MPTAGQAEPALALERIIFFSDAVFAIALTLLALELRLPAGADDAHGRELLDQLAGIWPKFLSFGTSFTVIALYWTAHHRLFRHVRRYDDRLVWLNILYLAAITLIPFCAAVLGDHLGDEVAEVLYFGNIVVLSVIGAVMWWYASRNHRLIDPSLSQRTIRLYQWLATAPVLVFSALIILILLGLSRIVEPLLVGFAGFVLTVGLGLFNQLEPD